jgi:hypothetical protein
MAVVVRYSDYEQGTPDQRIALMRAFPNVEDADQEVERLNAVAARQGQSTRYFVAVLNQREK